MKLDILALLMIATPLAMSAGCGTAPASPSQPSSAAVNIDTNQYRLTEEPDGAVGVIAARESAEDGAPLVLMGRIGGSANPWIDGRAAFTLLDASMTVVAKSEGSVEGELCMDDCCATERLNCTTLVKVVDDQGRLVPVDSRKLLGLKKSNMVVVRGTAKRDDRGNFVMLANGVFIRD